MTSIRRTLIVGLMAGVLAIALLASAATYYTARREIGELQDLQLKQLAYSTRIDDLLRGRAPTLGPRAPGADEGVTELLTQIWDHDGVLVYWSRPDSELPVTATPGYSTVRVNHRHWRVYTLVQGTHALQVAQAIDEREAIATRTALRTLLPFVVLIPLLGAMIWYGVGRGLSPLDAMSRAVGKRRPDALAPLAERGLPEELKPLAASLNALLARLDAALGAQRRFTADAAHELRTPLAALKLQVELVERAPDSAARSAALAELEAGVDRASHLVEQLLAMARLEPEALARNFGDCDLVALAKESIVARTVLAAGKRIDLGLARAAAVRVRGDAASLSILLANLLDNALRYTPEGGRIDVAVDDDAGSAMLTVADTGPGIPVAERERVFDRFYRGATAEVPSGQTGSGLGLSIVRRIADAHGATVTLDDAADGHGLVVRVRVPPNP